ncbi:MAG: hypothetical protein HXS46_20890 [Theionarchaea archaeon]|nr:MAG: hypothetical protein AYK18_10085 [Theionarchaea archaeon DG-70]MBU7013146.1 hypothetical protein [Theionarchaea archaeon]
MMCYHCGKREARIDGLCEPCFLENQPPLFIKSVKIAVCTECGALYYKSWRNIPLEDFIKGYINLKDADFTVEEHDHTYSVSVVARQIFHKDQPLPLVQETQFSIHVKDLLCDHCSKMLSGYYEAVLQVRRQGHVLTEEEREVCRDIVIASLRETDFISRINERKEGTDFYFSTAKAAKRAAESLRKQLGGTIKDSYKTVGLDRQTSTDIKRGTVLFSLHGYREGEMIYLKDSVYEVVHSGKKLHVKNGEEEKVLPWKQVEYLEKEKNLYTLSPSEYDISDCQVLDVTPGSVLIMKPDYTTIYLERPKDIKVDIGKIIRILFFQEQAYWM